MQLSLQISPGAQRLWPQASFLRQDVCCTLLGGALQDRWGWDWGCHPEWMQVESGVSPMKYLLVLCCLFFWGQVCAEGRAGGTVKRSVGVMGAQLE